VQRIEFRFELVANLDYPTHAHIMAYR
jgi:hypothetical protein